MKAADRFFSVLAGVTDPEDKRKAIGETFIRIFEEVARDIARFLGDSSLAGIPHMVSVFNPKSRFPSSQEFVGGLNWSSGG